MEMNLKTVLRAYPKVAPSLFADYVTKEELEAKDYVSHPELQNILADFVKEVVDGDPSTIYGRQNGMWVPIIEVPEEIEDVLCYGMINSDTINAAQLLTLKRQGLYKNVEEYLIEWQPTSNGYFWFCCTKEIAEITANNGLPYEQEVTQQSCPVYVTIENKGMIFNCYRTNKLAAIPGVKYKFKVRVQQGVMNK